jgi:hypothetical protein
MNKKSSKNVQPGLLLNKEKKVDCTSVSPSIANTNVVCSPNVFVDDKWSELINRAMEENILVPY